jgi:hypothetical protein
MWWWNASNSESEKLGCGAADVAAGKLEAITTQRIPYQNWWGKYQCVELEKALTMMLISHGLDVV